MNESNFKLPTILDYKKRVCLAMNFISGNLERNLSLEEIARAAHFSPFHFHRIFKAVVRETVAEFTRRLRLEWAANRLLANSHDSITLIAIECGFSTSQNFARAFRKHFGLSPTKFRNSKNGNMLSKGEVALSLKTSYSPDMILINEGRNEMKAEVKNMPDYHVAYVRKMGPYGKETCGQAFGELMRWAGPKGFLNSGTMLGLYWDNPEVTPPEKCRVDACISVPEDTRPEGQVGIQDVKGGPYAVCHFEIDEHGFQQAWDDAFKWLINTGYECADQPCYELYHNNAEEHPERKWIIDICIPLKG